MNRSGSRLPPIAVILVSFFGAWAAPASPDPTARPCPDWNVGLHPRLLADINGDRRADIVGFGDAGVWTALSNGDGTFAAAQLVLIEFGANQGWDPAKHERLAADINKDGMADLVGFGDAGVWTALARGDGGFPAARFVLANFGVNQGWTPSRHVRLMAEVNRDGMADIVAFGDDGVWTALAKGDGTFLPPKLVVGNFGTNQGWTPAKHVRTLADINGDGRADIVGFGDAGVWTALAKGDGGFLPEKIVLADFGMDSGWDPARHIRLMADWNRDGAADIVGFGNAGVTTSLSDRTGGFGPVRLALGEIFGCNGRLDFNLEWANVDRNGFPINPRWRWQRDNPGVPGASLCHYFSKTMLVGGIPVKIPDYADCTDQVSGIDTPDGWNGFICSQESSDGFHGHVNWFTATYAGALSWGDHNTDDDYYMALATPGDPAMLNDRHAMHTEFDSDETIDHFGSRWWKGFHQAVDDSGGAAIQLALCGDSCSPAVRDALGAEADRPRALFRKRDGTPVDAILTGLFGVDLEHDGGKSELHPVFAMAAHVDENPADDVWAIFLRNSGDEGYCSRRIWKADFTRYTFRLPWRAGMTSLKVLWGINETEFEGTAGTSGPSIDFFPPRWIDVTFTLPPASERPLIDGALHLQWQGSVIEAVPVVGAPQPRAEKHDEAESLRQAIEKLPASRRKEFERSSRPRFAVTLHPLPPGGPARQVSEAEAPAAAAVRLASQAGPADRKTARDVARARAVCNAWGGKPPGLPPDACAKLSP